MSKDCLISIIIPSFNDQDVLVRNVEKLSKFLKNKELSFEFIVVDDGSENPLTDLPSKKYIKLIRHENNQGKGAALRTGIEAAQGQYILMTDADLPFGNRTTYKFIEQMLRQKSDIIAGERLHKQSIYYSRAPFLRKVFSLGLRFLLQFWFGEKLDTQCGIKIMKQSAAKKVFGLSKINRFAFDAEIFLIARNLGYKVTPKPVQLVSTAGASVKLFSDSLNVLGDLVRIQMNNRKGLYGSSKRLNKEALAN